MAIDDPGDHVAEILILGGELYVRPDLGAGIAEPHGRNVACVDEGTEIPVLIFPEMDGGVEGVGEAIAEHPAEFRIGEQGLDFGYLFIDYF